MGRQDIQNLTMDAWSLEQLVSNPTPIILACAPSHSSKRNFSFSLSRTIPVYVTKVACSLRSRNALKTMPTTSSYWDTPSSSHCLHILSSSRGQGGVSSLTMPLLFRKQTRLPSLLFPGSSSSPRTLFCTVLQLIFPSLPYLIYKKYQIVRTC